MKRKKEKELTPCEEKALVHLQALQIKEKEKKAKARAKKRKVDTSSTTLTGQSLPFQPLLDTNSQNVPSLFQQPTPMPGRNAWDQLIPSAVQAAQLAIFNHAMNRQGKWKDDSVARVSDNPPNISLNPPSGNILGSRFNTTTPTTPSVTTPSVEPTEPTEGVMARLKRSFQSAKQRMKTIWKNLSRDRTKPNYMRLYNTDGDIEMDELNQDALDVDDEMSELLNLPSYNMTSRQLQRLKDTFREASANNDLELMNEIDTTVKEHTLFNMNKSEAQEFFRNTIGWGRQANIDHPRANIDENTGEFYIPSGRIKVYKNGTIGESPVRLKQQTVQEKQQIFEKFNPQNQSSSSSQNQSSSSSSSSQNQSSSSSFSSQNQQDQSSSPETPTKLKSEGKMGAKSPYAKWSFTNADGTVINTKKGGSSYNSKMLVDFSLNNRTGQDELRALHQSYIDDPSMRSVLRASPKSPNQLPYVKIDDNYMLSSDGVLVSRYDPTRPHPDYELKTNVGAQRIVQTRLQTVKNRDVLKWLQDPDNVAGGLTENFYKYHSPLPNRINNEPLQVTPNHILTSDGVVMQTASNDPYNENETSSLENFADDYSPGSMEMEFIE
jgi:hypothetical protein